MVENPVSCGECGDRAAVFWVYERYDAPDGVGGVEAETPMCRECTEGVGPSELEHAYTNYEFRVNPVAGAFDMETLQ
jgi:hypothetical protein